MERIIKEINHLLIQKNKTVATAESCTGGMVAELLTRLKGSSKYFLLGVIPYSNLAKEKILKLPHRCLLKEGAVSIKTTQFLAHWVRKSIRADIGIGITGFAGPQAENKIPVGTVFIAFDTPRRKICRSFYFKGNRDTVRRKAALKTLQLLKKIIR